MKFSRLRELLLLIDVVVLMLLLGALYYVFDVNIGRRASTLLILSLLVGYGMSRQVEGLCFDYYIRVVKILSWAFLFSSMFLVFTVNFERIGWCALVLGAWLVIALLVRLSFSGLIQRFYFAVPSVNEASLQRYPFISFLIVDSPDQVDIKNCHGLTIINNYDYSERWRQFIAHCQVSGFPVFSASAINERLSGRVSFEDLNKSWLTSSFYLSQHYIRIKRVFDLFLILLFAPLWLPIVLLVAVIIRVKMGGPVIFKQERVGQGNQRFIIYKFRTMIDEAGAEQETQAADARITGLGQFLRKYRFDELPQFFNVLKGDMSLIGPRPEWVFTAEKFDKEIAVYPVRQLVKPGISGWAQVNQGHAIGVDGNYEKLQYDIFYVKHFSFWLDMKILSKTVYTLLSGFGAK